MSCGCDNRAPVERRAFDDWRGVGSKLIATNLVYGAIAIGPKSDVDMVLVQGLGLDPLVLSHRAPLIGPFQGPLTISNIRQIPTAGTYAALRLELLLYRDIPPRLPELRAPRVAYDTALVVTGAETTFDTVPFYGAEALSYAVNVDGAGTSLSLRAVGVRLRDAVNGTEHQFPIWPVAGDATAFFPVGGQAAPGNDHVIIVEPDEHYDFIRWRGSQVNNPTLRRSTETRDT